MGNKIMQETTPLVECSAFHRGMSVLEASLRNTEDSDAIISGLLKGAAEFYGASRGTCSSACPWRSSRDGGKHFGPINRS